MEKHTKSEADVFSELAKLCASPGYLHAIAYFCLRDNTIGYSDVMTPDDAMQQLGNQHLVRTEISTLIGLACKVVHCVGSLPWTFISNHAVSRL